MLKQTKATTSERPSGKVRLAVVGTLVAIGIFAVGLRAPGPIGATAVVAAEAVDNQGTVSFPVPDRNGMKPTERAAFDATHDMFYIPENAVFVARIRPFEIFQDKSLQTAAKEINQFLASQPGWDLFSVEDIDTILVTTYEEMGELGARYVFRMKEPINKVKAEKILQAYMPRGTVKVGSYYHEKGDVGGPVYSKIDDRTFLFDSSTDSFKRNMQGDTTPPTWLGNAKPEATTQLWCAINSQKFDLSTKNGRLGDNLPMRFAAPMFRDMQRLVASAQIAPVINVKAGAVCLSPEAAGRVEETTGAMLVMFRYIITEQLRENVAAGTPAAALTSTLKILQPLLEGMQVEATGKNVLLTTTTELPANEFFQTLSPVFREADKSAKRVQSVNNLRQIALAFHNYASVHGHFPPAVLYDKETGTPYSWRVAILPYMEQNEIYKLYRFDEPWDSENNKKVLEYRPMQLLSPTNPSSTNTAYFALVGPGTVFASLEDRIKAKKIGDGFGGAGAYGGAYGEGGGKGTPAGGNSDSQKKTAGVQVQEIRDGTANTLLLVEAKRDIPWTKPEDIPYSPEKPLPKLGGLTKGGFNVAFCDGSVQFMADDIDPKTLRHLIEMADGNAVER